MAETDTTPEALDSLAYSIARYRAVMPRFAYQAKGREAAEVWQQQGRAKLLELILPLPVESVALDARWGARVRRPGYARRAVDFATRPNLRAFGYLLAPEGRRERGPAILCLPGHGRGVDEIVGIDEDGHDRDDPDGYQHDFAVQCARKGYMTLALEPLGFGHRRDEAARKRGASASSCQPAAGAALLLGETMVGWRTWDAMRALDLLASLPEVDPERIAMMGISGGGTITLYTAALDHRVKAAVLSCSFCTFRHSIYSVSHCIDNYVPGILNWFEMSDIAGLIAPRYLFCEGGTDDTIFPEPGVRNALADVARVYAAMGAADRIDYTFFKAGHSFHGEVAFQRLAAWL
jgi:dienelactone hydrolase